MYTKICWVIVSSVKIDSMNSILCFGVILNKTGMRPQISKILFNISLKLTHSSSKFYTQKIQWQSTYTIHIANYVETQKNKNKTIHSYNDRILAEFVFNVSLQHKTHQLILCGSCTDPVLTVECGQTASKAFLFWRIKNISFVTDHYIIYLSRSYRSVYQKVGIFLKRLLSQKTQHFQDVSHPWI